MGKEFEIANDTKLDTTGTSNSAKADFGGDLARDDGFDLNADSMSKRSEPYAAGRIWGSAMDGFMNPSDGAKLGAAFGGKPFGEELPPEAKDPLSQIYQAGWNVGVQGSEEYAQVLHDQYGPSAASELNEMQWNQEHGEVLESLNRPEPIESISYDDIPEEGMSIYDGETGIDLTDERLQGFESLEDVPQDILDNIKNNPAQDNESNEAESSIDDQNVDVGEQGVHPSDYEPSEEVTSDNTESIEQAEVDTSVADTGDNALDEVSEPVESLPENESVNIIEQPEIDSSSDDFGLDADESSSMDIDTLSDNYE
jgi:hypothetical protein